MTGSVSAPCGCRAERWFQRTIISANRSIRISSCINLLTIEVRKASNHQPVEHDQHKLRALTDPHLWFAYATGVLLTLARKNVTRSEIYAGGRIDPHHSIWFAGRLKEAGLAG